MIALQHHDVQGHCDPSSGVRATVRRDAPAGDRLRAEAQPRRLGSGAPRAERESFEPRDLESDRAPLRRRARTMTLQPVWYMLSDTVALERRPVRCGRRAASFPSSVRNTTASPSRAKLTGKTSGWPATTTPRRPRCACASKRRHSSRSSSSSPVRRSIRVVHASSVGDCRRPGTGPLVTYSEGGSAFRLADSFVANTAASVRRSMPSFASRFET